MAANLQFTPRVAPTEWNELNFRGLYLYHTISGPKANQAAIVSMNNADGSGTTAVNNWEVYDGLAPDAKVVAHAQGLHFQAFTSWINSFSLVFEDERGSTLQVMGAKIAKNGELAIVGGTGQFARATGVIFKRLHQRRSDGNIVELTVSAFCPLPVRK